VNGDVKLSQSTTIVLVSTGGYFGEKFFRLFDCLGLCWFGFVVTVLVCFYCVVRLYW